MKKKLLCGVIMAAVITLCAVHTQNVYAIDKNIEIPANPEVEMINVPVIKWDKAKNGTYRVYRSDRWNGKYKCVAKDITDASFIDRSANEGKTYYYRIRSTKLCSNGKRKYGEWTNIIKVKQSETDNELSIENVSGDLYFKWSNYDETCTYSLWKSDSYNGTYNCVKDGIKSDSYKLDSDMTSEVAYYKVAPYKKISGKRRYGNLSNMCRNNMDVTVVLFSGQSNMAGRGENKRLAPVLEKNVAFEYRAVTDPGNLYYLEEPFGVNENRTDGINDVYPNGIPRKSGGMVSMVCKTYFENTGIPIVGVSASQSSTALAKFLPGTPIYNDTEERLSSCLEYLRENGYNIKHIYMVWCQGESDSNTDIEKYEEGVKSIVEGFRTDFGLEMCFISLVGPSVNSTHGNVSYAQRDLSMNYPYCTVASGAAEYFLEQELLKGDGIHYKQQAYNIVGKQVGYVMAAYTNNRWF